MLDCFGLELDAEEVENWGKLTRAEIGAAGSHFKAFRVREVLPTPETCVVAPDFWEFTLLLSEEIVRGANVMELGCGNGPHAESILALGGSYVGVDISRHAVACTRGTYALCERVRCFHTVDDRDEILALAGTFDIVFGVDFFIHQPTERYAALTAFAAAMLKPGGWYSVDRWIGPTSTVETEQCGVDWRGFQRTREEEEAILRACGLELVRYCDCPLRGHGGAVVREYSISRKPSEEPA